MPLVAEATADGHSVLVFCSSRKQCESAGALIADLLPQVRCLVHCAVPPACAFLAVQPPNVAQHGPHTCCCTLAGPLPQISLPPADKQAELAARRQAIIADIKIAMGGAMSAELEACMLQGGRRHGRGRGGVQLG